MNHIHECRILLVDDNQDILEMIKNILARRGFTSIQTASDCCTAREMFRQYKPELIVLDIMLPDGDGFSLMRDFRLTSDVPVLFLSARDEDNSRLFGLGLGADDYITKPFLPDELLLRLTAILKRTYFSTLCRKTENSALTLGSRTIFLESGTVAAPEATLTLTAKELAPTHCPTKYGGKITMAMKIL